MQQKIFAQFRDKTLDDFEFTDLSNPTLGKAVETVRYYIDRLPEMKAQGKGLTFMGENGVGKTFLACKVIEAAMERYLTECIEMSTFLEMHHDLISFGKFDFEDDWFKVKERLRYIRNRAHFVLLDDMGREHSSDTGWSNGIVFNVLRYRYSRGLPTLITTNLPMDYVLNRYTEGMSSFLQESSVIVPMEGEDFRWRGAS